MKKKKFSLPARYMLFFIMMVCVIVLAIHFFMPSFTENVNTGISSFLMPMQKGMSSLGSGIVDEAENLVKLREAQKENEELRAENEELKVQINQNQQEQYELAELRKLLDLKSEYEGYEMVGARVIQKDAGNWFHSFIIDKGGDDGIQVDMNVLAGGGLVGIVTEVGSNYARVQSIIDDTSKVSAMSMSSKDACVVSGNLELYEDGLLELGYIDKNDNIWDDDKIVTSNVSDKYLPGLLIGYAKDITVDANNMTKSGYLTPAADFNNLQTVLVIKTLKVTGSEGVE